MEIPGAAEKNAPCFLVVRLHIAAGQPTCLYNRVGVVFYNLEDPYVDGSVAQ